MFEMPIEDAAVRLGSGVTLLKKASRKLGVPRWPYRKLKSLDSIIEGIRSKAARDPASTDAINKQLEYLRR